MPFCRKQQLNPRRRQFLSQFAVCLLLTAVASMVYASFKEGHLGMNSAAWAKTVVSILSVLPILPFLGMMLLIPRYLRQETDEFVRTLVLRALLWGFAVPMVLDTVWGFCFRVVPVNELMPILNLDIFCVTVMLLLRLQWYRYNA